MLVAGPRLRRVAASRQQEDRKGDPQITQMTQIFRSTDREAVNAHGLNLRNLRNLRMSGFGLV